MPWTAEQKKQSRKVQKAHLKEAKPPPKTCEQSTQTEGPILAKGAVVRIGCAFTRLCGLDGAPATEFQCDLWNPHTQAWRLVVTSGPFRDKVLTDNVPEEALSVVKAKAGSGEVRTKTDPKETNA